MPQHCFDFVVVRNLFLPTFAASTGRAAQLWQWGQGHRAHRGLCCGQLPQGGQRGSGSGGDLQTAKRGWREPLPLEDLARIPRRAAAAAREELLQRTRWFSSDDRTMAGVNAAGKQLRTASHLPARPGALQTTSTQRCFPWLLPPPPPA